MEELDNFKVIDFAPLPFNRRNCDTQTRLDRLWTANYGKSIHWLER